MTASEDRVWAVVEPVVQDQGYDLEALSVMAAGRRRLVKIVTAGRPETARRFLMMVDMLDVVEAVPCLVQRTSKRLPYEERNASNGPILRGW